MITTKSAQPAGKMPVIYFPHGGGPWPWTPAFTPALAQDYRSLRQYLEHIADTLPQKPSAIVVISAHWQEAMPTVMSHAQPPMFYDYYGFPTDTYHITWPAAGSPQLARRVQHVLAEAGIRSAENTQRGFDHGTFVPLKLAFPQADIPTIQLSLDAGFDPARHIEIGRALSALREEGVLIIGSGMSWENFRARDLQNRSDAFDAWLRGVVTADGMTRNTSLARWTDAPFAREGHPHEEHLLPLMVAAGAAGQDRGRVVWNGSLIGIRLSAVHFG